MRALVIEGTAEEIADFVRKTGLTVVESAPSATEQGDDVDRFIRQRVRGNAEKHGLVTTYLSGVATLGTVRVRPAIKEDGTENTYLKGRLTTLDEDRVGDVLYCRPSASTLHLRLPFEEVQGNRFARRIGSQQSAEKFARVKHQVIVKLTSDEAVAEAVKLTKLAVEMALDGRW
jgi:hypothetical protein